MFNINNIKTAIIFGAGHGIGLEISKRILYLNPNAKILCTYRNTKKAHKLIENNSLKSFRVDPSTEEDILTFKEEVKNMQISKFDLILNSIGFLHDHETMPEKSLRDVNLKNFQKLMNINSFITLNLAHHFIDMLHRDTSSVFLAISAKVGSIEDNRMGGWYSYRASKAALNMILKNISIELGRKNKNSIILSIHPGTTDTELSSPFTKNTPYKLHTPEQTAENILNTINGLDQDSNGKFLTYEGEEIPW